MTDQMPKFDIRPDHWQIVRDILQKHVPDHEVWAFGSRAKWTAKEYSDLDLAVITDKPLSLAVSANLSDDFSESDLPWKVDVVDWATTSDAFREIIERDKVVVQKPSHCKWRPTTWGNEISLEYGKSLRNYEASNGKYRVFGSNGPIGWTEKPLAQGPGVILGRKGAYRGVRYSEYPFFVIDTAYYVVPKSDLDMQWLYYAIKYHKLGEIDDGSPVPSTTRAAVYVKNLLIPPPSEQQHMARILRSIDEKIDLNRRINQTLEAMAQAIFKSWFVDFDPVKAKIAAQAEGRDPRRAAMCAISGKTEAELEALPREQYDQLAATAALFPEEMVESELGEVPMGWRFSTIGEEVLVVGGGTPSTANPDYWSGKFAWVTPKDLSNQSEKVLLKSERYLTELGVKKISSGQLPVGTVLLSSRAPIGYLALTMIPVSINQGFIGMICNKKLPNTYVIQWAEAKLDEIKQRGSGTTFAEISKTNFRPMTVIVPDEKILTMFHREVMPLYEDTAALTIESNSLVELRDSLLPKLLSGELSVADIVAPTHKSAS